MRQTSAGLISNEAVEQTAKRFNSRPSLTQHGVSDALADPALQFVDASGLPLEPNDNWRTDRDQAEIAAAGVAAESPRVCASGDYPAGYYTATVAGNNSGGPAVPWPKLITLRSARRRARS